MDLDNVSVDYDFVVTEIEKFFSGTFQALSPGPGRELYQFDGKAHWSVLFDDRQTLSIVADRHAARSALPIVEIVIHCSRISAAHASGVGPVLILHPNGVQDSINCLVLTKAADGTISISTTIGREQKPD